MLTQPAQILRNVNVLRTAYLAGRGLHTRIMDRWLGIDTLSMPKSPIQRKGQFNDSRIYEAIPYRLLQKFIAFLHPSHDDIVFDIGCGLGRILCLFSRMNVKECIGIEISHDLAEIARKNAATLHTRRSPISIRVADAATTDYSGGTIYCLFNPFGAETLQVVLERIRISLDSNPRPIQIAYFNPIHDDILNATPWLACSGRLKAKTSRMKASYWINDLRKISSP